MLSLAILWGREMTCYFLVALHGGAQGYVRILYHRER
jgi:hypothetical protein